MRTLYVDCTSGVSGDMLLGALIDLGVSPGYLTEELKKLDITGYDLVITQKERCGIIMTDVDVKICQEENLPATAYDQSGRSHSEIIRIIENSGLSHQSKEISKAVFGEIARAEAKVHRVPTGKVTFHEKGALDSIIDIVGVAVCISALQVERILASELHDGQGFIAYRFGKLPVPVPAVVAMLAGTQIPVVREDVNTELITPTGMGLIKCLSQGYGPIPSMRIKRVGYGSGKRETGLRGAVRAVIGEMDADVEGLVSHAETIFSKLI